LAIARQRVASAIEGAALKRPAKLFGLKRSPMSENTDTARPPMRNLNRRSDHILE
jgi:hypothetical protein